MAKIRVKNLLETSLGIPGLINAVIPANTIKEFDVIDLDFVFNDTRVDFLVKRGAVELTRVEDDTPPGSPTLPFYAVGDLPPAATNSGIMVYNTSDEMVMFSDGTQWLALERIPTYAGGLPAPASVPASYLVFDKDNQTLWVNSGSQWMLTMASGIEARASHQFPAANTVPIGTMIFDTDNDQLRLSDGTAWQLTNNVNDYNSVGNLPAVTDVGFGALVFTSRDGTLWSRVGSNFIPCTGLIRYYATFSALPTNATWGNDESGAIAYVHDIRTFLVWGGKNWRHLMTPETFTTATVPATASGYITGHIIYNSDTEQHLHSSGGAWEGIQGSARSYTAVLRPLNANVPEGTIIWNTTSNKANWNIGGQWLDALGTVDP